MLTLWIAVAALNGTLAQDVFDPEKCRVPLDRGLVVLAMAPAPKVAAGEQAKLRPSYTTNPGAFDALPAKCFSDWRVSDRKVATLSRDRTRVNVATDAKAGTRFVVSARFQGRRIEQVFEVIAPVVSPIVGFWSQEQVEACPSETRVFDLVSERTGDFAVSFGPSYPGQKDYCGKWRVEGDRLLLSDITGTRPADFVSEVTFKVGADGSLSFDKPWLGTQRDRGTCSAPFRKLRP